MPRLSRRSIGARGFRARLGLGLLLAALGATACGGWRMPPPHQVPALTDASASYLVVLDTLKNEHYAILEQDAATRTVRVRSHVDEKSASRVTVILLHVQDSAVYLSASGYLVRPDGTAHHALISELASLHEALQKKFGGATPGTSSASGASLAAPAAPAGSLPLAWSEPASNSAVWGSGNFTCLPIKLADEEQTQLTLHLSNGETADVLLSLAHAPELCRSPSQCKLAGGCPALGIADAERVSRLAARLSKHEVGPLATLYSRGQAIAVIDLSKHGSIAQAMTEKH
ncbi:MAG TPA: hypothetical protein VER11_22735 [Polyangiaceae bacterium]|nr:hypothetical protein [Polyangiaceae bacterium]